MVCDLIVVPLEWMQKEGQTFAEVVADPDELGVSAAIAFGVSARGLDRAGPFQPVIGYLARRASAATSPGNTKQPTLAPAIEKNARELDAFLADGGCG